MRHDAQVNFTGPGPWEALRTEDDSRSVSFGPSDALAATPGCAWAEGGSGAAETELVLFKGSPIHGTGGFAKMVIRRGTRVLEYRGERISKSESLRRCENDNRYIFSLNPREDLDGSVAWNPARFINHSCAPNCEAELEGDHIWIVARRDIQAGEEITFNYGYDLVDYRDHPCHCRSANCVGYIVAEEFHALVLPRQAGGRSKASVLP